MRTALLRRGLRVSELAVRISSTECFWRAVKRSPSGVFSTRSVSSCHSPPRCYQQSGGLGNNSPTKAGAHFEEISWSYQDWRNWNNLAPSNSWGVVTGRSLPSASSARWGNRYDDRTRSKPTELVRDGLPKMDYHLRSCGLKLLKHWLGKPDRGNRGHGEWAQEFRE